MTDTNRKTTLSAINKLLEMSNTTKIMATVIGHIDPTSTEINTNDIHCIGNEMDYNEYLAAITTRATTDLRYRAAILKCGALIWEKEHYLPRQDVSVIIQNILDRANIKKPLAKVDLHVDQYGNTTGTPFRVIDATDVVVSALYELGYQANPVHPLISQPEIYDTLNVRNKISSIVGNMSELELSTILKQAKFTIWENNRGELRWNLFPTDC